MQLREKDLAGRELFRLAEELRVVTTAAGAPFFVNDRADVARAAGADGVHLPAGGLRVADVRRLWPEALVGVSTHAPEEVAGAAVEGADFTVFGPVYDTPEKRPYGAPLGLAALAEAARGRLPVYAIGGVGVAEAAEVSRAGARGVACIRAVLGAPDPARAVAGILGALMSSSPCAT